MKGLSERSILLVHPLGYETQASGHDISRLANIMPPLGLAGIASYLDREGVETRLVDYYAKPDSDRFIIDYLREKRPAFLGLSCTTSSFLDGVRVAELAKSVLPGIRVICGGHHVSALKQKTMVDFPAIDMVVVGEGEKALWDIVNASRDDHAVPGVIYRLTDNTLFEVTSRQSALELDTLPFPAYHKLDGFPHAYRLPIFNYPTVPSTSCLSSRGCVYACSYCDRSVFGRTFRCNSAEYLYEHLAYLVERFKIRHVNFYDDQFTYNRERIIKFARMICDKPPGITFNCAVRADHIDEELLQHLKDAGCWMISLGIETGDSELLRQYRKNVDLETLKEKIRMISRAGIRTKGLFMVGLPGETEQSVRRSIDYLRSLPIDDINVSIFTPFPGSPLYRRAKELGHFEEDWKKMDCMHFQFVPEGMSREEMKKLFHLFYRSHFLRLKVLIDYITMMWRSPDSWKRFVRHLIPFLRFAHSNSRLGSNE